MGLGRERLVFCFEREMVRWDAYTPIMAKKRE